MKIFFDKEHIINDTFCSEQIFLIPFLTNKFITTNPEFINVEDYKEKISNHITLTSLNECDVIVYPNKLDNTKFLSTYINLANEQNKPLILFYNDDNDTPFTDLGSNCIIYRTSFNKKDRRLYENALPAWSRDFKKYATIPTRKYSKPVIGFCGALTHPLRNLILNKFNPNSSKYTTNFLIRDHFWGGKPNDDTLRNEYVHNMINSDFILCTRGAGNFSYRFYETLSAGRIPIFIDSNTPIPFEDKVDFSKYFPIVQESDIPNIPDIVVNFWNNISNYDNLQFNLRNIYENYFSPYGFVTQIANQYE